MPRRFGTYHACALVPTFRSSCSIAAHTFANFGKSLALANLSIPVPLYRSEVPDRIRRLRCRGFRSAVLVLTVAAPLSITANSAFAYTLEAQQMCTGDAFRLCSAEIPSIPKITACMVRHRSDLSAGCRAVMDRDFAAQKSRTIAEK